MVFNLHHTDKMNFTSADSEIEVLEISANNIAHLESTVTKCVICKFGDVQPCSRNENIDSDIVIYARDGMMKGIHREKRCNNYKCRTGYFYGYHVKNGVKYM